MLDLLLLAGFFVFVGSMAYLVFSFFKKNGKMKKAGLGILAGFMLMIVWGVFDETPVKEDIKEPLADVKREDPKKDNLVAEVPIEEKPVEEAPVKEVPKEEVPVKENSVETKPTESMGQKNAKASAKSYLNYTSFSRSGLIEQLEYEEYSNDDATYAVDAISVDWYEQAVLSAKSYLDYTSFSRGSLIEQLEFEGFSYEEAVYGVEENGY